MTEAGYILQRAAAPLPLPRRGRRALTAALLWTLLTGNAAVVVWLWVHGGNLTDDHGTGALLTSLGRLTGLFAAYGALLQVVLLARLPWLERLVGFDRLTVWHRWNGHATLDLVLAHVVLTVYGYSLTDKISLPKEISTMLGGGIYPGMITATVGTGLLIAVVISSIVIVRRRLRYEAWHAVHLAAYAGIALAWFHQIPPATSSRTYSRPRTTGARCTSRLSPSSSASVSSRRSSSRCATGCTWRTSSPKRPASSPCAWAAGTFAASARARDSSSSGASSTAGAGGRHIRSLSRSRRTADRSESP